MAEQQITGLGQKAAPLDRKTKDSELFELLQVRAKFNGAAAAGAWTPMVEIVSDSGRVVGSYPAAASLTTGDTVEATFAPFLRNGVGLTGVYFDIENTGNFLHVTTVADVDFEVLNFFVNATGAGSTVDIEAESSLNLVGRDQFNLESSGALLISVDRVLEHVATNFSTTVVNNYSIAADTFNLDTDGNAALGIGGNYAENITGGFINITESSWSVNAADVGITSAVGDIALGLPTGGALTVFNHLGHAIFKVDEDGDLHGLTGKALVFDL